jgi:hypothetical protein
MSKSGFSANKPFITSVPMEGLTAQALESEGGLLFTAKDILKRKVIELACDQQLRFTLGENLKHYLDHVVSWEVVARQYTRLMSWRARPPAQVSPSFWICNFNARSMERMLEND